VGNEGGSELKFEKAIFSLSKRKNCSFYLHIVTAIVLLTGMVFVFYFMRTA